MTIATVCQILVPELGTMLSAFYALSYLIIPIPYSISILQIRGLLLILMLNLLSQITYLLNNNWDLILGLPNSKAHILTTAWGFRIEAREFYREVLLVHISIHPFILPSTYFRKDLR